MITSEQAYRLNGWASRLEGKGLATPALIMLGMSGWLGPVAGDCLEACAPFLPPHGRNWAIDLAGLLSDPLAVAHLTAALAERAN